MILSNLWCLGSTQSGGQGGTGRGTTGQGHGGAVYGGNARADEALPRPVLHWRFLAFSCIIIPLPPSRLLPACTQVVDVEKFDVICISPRNHVSLCPTFIPVFSHCFPRFSLTIFKANGFSRPT